MTQSPITRGSVVMGYINSVAWCPFCKRRNGLEVHYWEIGFEVSNHITRIGSNNGESALNTKLNQAVTFQCSYNFDALFYSL